MSCASTFYLQPTLQRWGLATASFGPPDSSIAYYELVYVSLVSYSSLLYQCLLAVITSDLSKSLSESQTSGCISYALRYHLVLLSSIWLPGAGFHKVVHIETYHLAILPYSYSVPSTNETDSLFQDEMRQSHCSPLVERGKAFVQPIEPLRIVSIDTNNALFFLSYSFNNGVYVFIVWYIFLSVLCQATSHVLTLYRSEL